ncbi:putative OPA3-like protein CG13603 [Gigantopelta aegis]|uniref:putative OPA3-like protein CG13603 n=1 Tax=Gigantopelta aegis TaxID=1735272 RepID=UPI001B88E4C2|nr:putative OPA3-like protein CG13603 [Gigantopelta aegis]
MVAFPLVKLASLAIKQISKPLAQVIKNRAKKYAFFRTYICMPPAQFFHWFEVNVRLRLMGMGKAQQVEKLNDEMAIDLGAEMLGEFVIYSVAAMTIYLEYSRSSAKEQIKEEQHIHDMISLQQKIQELGITTERQEAQLHELERIVNDLDSRNKSLTSRIFGSGK